MYICFFSPTTSIYNFTICIFPKSTLLCAKFVWKIILTGSLCIIEHVDHNSFILFLASLEFATGCFCCYNSILFVMRQNSFRSTKSNLYSPFKSKLFPRLEVFEFVFVCVRILWILNRPYYTLSCLVLTKIHFGAFWDQDYVDSKGEIAFSLNVRIIGIFVCLWVNL